MIVVSASELSSVIVEIGPVLGYQKRYQEKAQLKAGLTPWIFQSCENPYYVILSKHTSHTHLSWVHE